MVIYPELQDREWLHAQRSAGKSAAEIAADLGCSVPAVTLAVRRLGLARVSGRPRGIAPNPLLSDKDWVTERVLAGDSYYDLSVLAETTTATVSLWVSRHGLREEMRRVARERRVEREREAQAKRRGPLPPKFPLLHDRDWLLAQREAGRKLADIAAELGCDVSSVSRAIARASSA